MSWTTAQAAREAGAIDLEHALTRPGRYEWTECTRCRAELYIGPDTDPVCRDCRIWPYQEPTP